MSVKSNGLKFVNLLEYLYVYEKIPQGSIDTGDVAVKHQIEVNLLDFPVLQSILLFVKRVEPVLPVTPCHSSGHFWA